MFGAFIATVILLLGASVTILLIDQLFTVMQNPATAQAFEGAAEQTATAAEPIGTPWVVALLGGAVAAYAALGIYRARADLDRYSLTAVGTYPRVEHHVAETPAVACRDCRRDLRPGDRAERRRYWRETVIAGAVVARTEQREAHYCSEHAAREVRDELEPIEATPTGPAPAKSQTDAVENRIVTDGGLSQH
jgi:hypothetical protein